MSIKEIFQHIPTEEVLHTFDELVESGCDKATALDLVAGLLDKALPLDILVPQPAGAVLEALDGPVLRAALGLLWTLAANAKARAARKARRAKTSNPK